MKNTELHFQEFPAFNYELYTLEVSSNIYGEAQTQTLNSYPYHLLRLCTTNVNNERWFSEVSLFNGLSTFVGYLIPKPFSQKNSRGTI